MTHYQLVVKDAVFNGLPRTVPTMHYIYERALDRVKQYQKAGFFVCLMSIQDNSLINSVEFEPIHVTERALKRAGK